jgi:hypothetical protein
MSSQSAAHIMGSDGLQPQKGYENIYIEGGLGSNA